MPVLGQTAERALALAAAAGAGATTQDQAVQELASGANRDELDHARAELLRRIYGRSDDYEATVALSVVNKALAAVGWLDLYNWQHRRKP